MAKNNYSSQLQDVDLYLKELGDVLKRYQRINDKLDKIKTDKKKALERIDLVGEREQVKNSWITKKQACRANIKLLPEGLGLLKEKELKDLQEQYREMDADFKAMGVSADRTALLAGSAAERNGFDASRANNDTLLDKAKEVQEDTTSKLKDGLRVLEGTRDQAKMTAAQLEQDREKINRINLGLDEVTSELDISKKLITRFVKRMYTDKMIIAFTFLVVVGLAGIIVYASLNPNQNLFNVPDAVKPAITSPTPSPSSHA